jgi:hypothetical protein
MFSLRNRCALLQKALQLYYPMSVVIWNWTSERIRMCVRDTWTDIERMSHLRGNQRRARRLVFSTVPFCQSEDGSQNHVCVPISACKCGQFISSLPRSNVIDRRAISGRSLMALMILPITGLVRLFGFFRITVNRLTRSTNVVTFVWPSFYLNSIKSPSQCPNSRR